MREELEANPGEKANREVYCYKPEKGQDEEKR